MNRVKNRSRVVKTPGWGSGLLSTPSVIKVQTSILFESGNPKMQIKMAKL